jgi:hypothetical protein
MTLASIKAWLLANLFLLTTILCGTGLAIEYYQLHGLPIIQDIPIVGKYVWQGYKPMYEAAALDNSTLKANQAALQNGVKTCNASIATARAWGVQHGAEAQASADAKKAGVEAAQRERDRLLAIKPGTNALVTAQRVGLRGVAQ